MIFYGVKEGNVMKKGEQVRGKQWYYRGSLKSCNYACEYCPFSKKTASAGEIRRDEKQLARFVDTLCGMDGQACSVQIVPYGEALLHEYYWREMARLSRREHIELVGAQTNGSFPVEHMLAIYREHGGDVEKLRLWCTFHPAMTTGEAFLHQCQLLLENEISFCVGTVGVPEQREDIRWLRENLPAEVYLWVNRYDALKRAYSEEEVLAFLEIDPFFFLELAYPKAEVSGCGHSVFVEGDGSCKRCNIDRGKTWNLYDSLEPGRWMAGNSGMAGDGKLSQDMGQGIPPCHRKRCSCFLAYCNQSSMPLQIFGKYPAFRIPSFPKAFFLDVDGTLVPRGKSRVPERSQAILRGLRRFSRLFLATSLPWIDASCKTRDIAMLLSGGVYAGGGHCVIHGGALPGVAGADRVFALAESVNDCNIRRLKQNQKARHYRVHVYERRGEAYKVTLVFSGKGLKEMQARQRQAQEQKNMEGFYRELRAELGIEMDSSIQYEEGCLQILAPGVCKLSGVKYICQQAGFAREDVIAYGDGEADRQMMEYYNSVYLRANPEHHAPRDCPGSRARSDAANEFAPSSLYLRANEKGG